MYITSSSKETSHLLLAGLLLLNIIFRIPWTPHGIDIVDSTFVWSLANSISASGVIKWALHPLSFFGLYPLSYPSGSPVVLSVTSQVTGVSIENIILIYGLILGILGILGSYIMALKIKKCNLFAFFTSFVFSTAPVFLELTRWSASARNLFLALFPLFLWSIFWFNKRETCSNKSLLLAIIFLAALMATHRLSFLIILVLTAFALVQIIWYIKDKSSILNCTDKLSENAKFFALIMLFLLAFALQFSGLGFYKNIWYDYRTGGLSQGIGLSILLLNLSTNYVGQIGILLPIGIIGFFELFRKNNKNLNDSFIICLLILSASILALGIYTAPFLLPIISLLIASGVCYILRFFCNNTTFQGRIKKDSHYLSGFHKKLPAMLLFVCLLSSIGFSGYMIERHLHAPLGYTGDKTWMTREPYVGSFLKEQGTRTFLSNDRLLSGRIYASTSVPYLDVGAISLINSWIDQSEREVEYLSPKTMNIHKHYISSLINQPKVYEDFNWIYSNEIQNDNSKKILDRYEVDSIVINNDISNKLVEDDFLTHQSVFAESVTNSESRIYDNSKESIYMC